MGMRRQAREAALQALFMCDCLSTWDSEAVKLCLDHFGVPRPIQGYALQLSVGVIDNLSRIDSEISCASEHWSLSRMGRVDRSLLRLATFEMIFLDEVPLNVSIDEAIEIAKKFGTDNSPVFINGVLDRVATTQRSRLAVAENTGENLQAPAEEELQPPVKRAASQ